MTQMPIYNKFLKDILSNRRKLEEVQIVTLNTKGVFGTQWNSKKLK
jgi:hypothetical protein